MPYDPTIDQRQPWKLPREEYLEYLNTLEPQDWFDEVTDWGTVERLDFDMMTQRLVLEYKLAKYDPPHMHTVVFEEVRAVFFESGYHGVLIPPEIAKDDKGWEGALFRPRGLYRITQESLDPILPSGLGGEKPVSVANFGLSFHVFQQMLSIEARRVTIDGRAFDVGYPTPWRYP